MDVSLNGDNECGIKLTKKILAEYPLVKVIAFSAEDKLFRIKQLIESGVSGYISKSSKPIEFDTAIHKALKGECYFVLRNLDSDIGTHKYYAASQVLSLMPQLSSLQMELLQYVATQYSYEEIAVKMHRTVGSVEQLRKNLFTAVGVKTRQELVSYAITNGLL
jgi:DNA-binding NarL/FixJ family response regulator